MACLINSIDELPKIVEMEWPTGGDSDWLEFAQNYVCIVNGTEVPLNGAHINTSTGVVTISYDDAENGIDFDFTPYTPKSNKKIILPSYAREIDVHDTSFDPLTSLTLCEKSSGGKTICGTPICDEGKEGLVINPVATKIGNEYAGISTQDKPTGVPQYSLYLELDTGKFYYYDNGEWNEIPCGGGSTPEDTRPYIVLDDGISPEDVLIANDPDNPFDISELIEFGAIEFKDGKYYIDPNGANVLYFFADPYKCYAIDGYGTVTVSSPAEVPISPSLKIVIAQCQQ